MVKLTDQQWSDYKEFGYVVVRDIFTKEELLEMDQEMDRLEEKNENKEEKGWIKELGLKSEKTRSFSKDERILSLIERIVKPGIAIYSSKLTAKQPHSDTVCHWHQDDIYYIQNSESETRMSVWIPLQEANENNGCLWVVPRSHLKGLHDHIQKESGTCRISLSEKEHDFSNAIPVPVSAGSVVLFDSLTWHSSKGNRTDQVRRAFIISYQEATARGGNGEQWEIIS